MSLVRLRRRSAPLSVVTLAVFLLSLSPLHTARAGERARVDGTAAHAPVPATPEPAPSSSTTAVVVDHPPAVTQERPVSTQTSGTEVIGRPNVEVGNDALGHVEASPVGGDKTGVSSQAISIPQGAGKVQGMGESFSTQLSTGVASLTVPFALIPARGGAQPSLALGYSSASGHGVAGVGWDVGAPFIARQTDRGIPQYNDPPLGTPWLPGQDRFVFNGGQELVPICLVSGASCPGALANEGMPVWADGWRYFRPRVEGSFLRFFWSGDHRTWRVQSKRGTTMELGVPLNDAAYVNGTETDPGDATKIFRWNIVREYDAHGNANPSGGASPAPVNVVVYRYTQDAAMAYLSDVYDTPPAANPSSAQVSAYAHHTHLSYVPRPDAEFSYRRGWQTVQGQRLAGVDVTSQSFGAAGARELVRRYHLAYDGSYHLSLLTSVQMEGRCSQPVTETQGGPNDGLLPSTNCPTLPAMTFGYQHVAGFDTGGNPLAGDLPGYEPFDERVHTMAGSPDHSIDEALTDLFDINADGLPDVVVAAPFLYGGKHAVFFNGAGGVPDAFGGNTCLDVTGVAGEDTNVIRLDNPNVAAHDINGDGIIDLLHMPLVKTYSIYTPRLQGGQCPWFWQGRPITTASMQSPKIDFVNHNDAIKVMDVNADGLVDIVFSSGTEYQTFFALGRYPTGDTQYGYAAWTAPGSSSVSNDPVTSCLPWSATPALLSDPDVKLGDMNGDGLPDIVRVRPGDIRYWPGRGNGYWGTGDPNGCPGGTFGQGQHIAMTTGPQFGVVDSTESLLLDDVNGDGLDDLVKIEFEAIYVWLNVDGNGWTSPHIVQNSPPRVPSVDRLRMVDANGSGTRDILYGDGYSYKYIDVNGGQRPWVLTHVQNGLGKTTDIQYGSSSQLMLADAKAGNAWTSVAPMPIHVVTQVADSDNLSVVGRPAGVYITQYAYRDPVYDGRQREFRGFRTATARRVGDANSPSSTTSSTFLLGECKNDENVSPDPCSDPGRWQENPREALKGLPVLSETFDDHGTYASTTHHTYTLRKLYTGLDGREVRYAFESAGDAYRYDTGPFTAGTQAVSLAEVLLETTLGSPQMDAVASVTLRATVGRAHLQKNSSIDPFGNPTASTDAGCVDGCTNADEVITTTTTPAVVPGDPTGWLWRTTESYVTGTVTPGTRHHTRTTYDLGGNPTLTTADLSGTMPLDRTRAGANIAPGASQEGPILVSAQTYDTVLGTLEQQTGPDHRCRQIVYDATYGELPVQETVFVGEAIGDCTGTPLRAVAVYDRGLRVVQQVIDLHGELTTAGYDGLGRLTTLSRPDPSRVGQVSTTPSVVVDYTLPSNPTVTPYSIVHTQTQDGPDATTSSYRNAYAYADGFGRVIVTLDQADAGQWIVNGLTDYDAKGAKRRAFLASFWSGPPVPFPFGTVPASAYGSQRYDAFGRPLQTFGLDGTIALQSAYHALSVDKWDAADLLPGPHQGTPASVLQDGHGRTIAVTERVHNGSAIEGHETRTTYLSTGEPAVLTRVRVGSAAPPVVRSLQYDSLGRMVLNVEPDTSTAARAWRYAYDDAGDLVGTSDARGCGADYYYDAGGRILAEDFSPCTAAQQGYSPPELDAQGYPDGTGTEAFYRYDSLDPDTTGISGFTVDATLLLGRLVSVSDRGAKALTSYDGRGRTTAIARRIAKPGMPDASLSTRFAPHWYTQSVAFDGADRPVSATTGADVAELLDASGQSYVTTTYAKRGTVSHVGSGYGDLVTSVARDADGLVSNLVYGDAAHTTSSFGYDSRRRLASVQTYRGPPAIWSSPPPGYSPDPSGAPSTFQLLLQDLDYVYDAVDNPVEIRDFRNPVEWPVGAQPVTRKIQYDDLYRVTDVGYAYPAGSDTWVSPFNAENNNTGADPRRASPSPHVRFDKRMMHQSFQYDWLGNTTRTDDDAAGFYDRSLGAITNGTASAGPYQLRAANGAASTRDGSLSASYDEAGNLVAMSINRAGPCLPNGATCSQQYTYEWDEIGRIAKAKRWDSTVASGTPSAELDYAYDATDSRTLKTAVGAAAGGADAQSVYVFGSLELRRTTWSSGDYARDSTTEVAYLSAHGVQVARLHYALNSEPTATSGRLHVLLALPDHLGSTSLVVDKETSELVEAATYQPYGASESDYRPERWASFREDYAFTGKEQDVELGLEYFGKRYLSPALGRWASADPLTVHGLSADANAYAYVHGRLLRATDPTGLECGVDQSCAGPGGQEATSSQAPAEEVSSESPAPTRAQPQTPGLGPGAAGPNLGAALSAQNAAAEALRPLATTVLKPAEVISGAVINTAIGIAEAAKILAASPMGQVTYGTKDRFEVRLEIPVDVDALEAAKVPPPADDRVGQFTQLYLERVAVVGTLYGGPSSALLADTKATAEGIKEISLSEIQLTPYKRTDWISSSYKTTGASEVAPGAACQYCQIRPATTIDHVISGVEGKQIAGLGFISPEEVRTALSQEWNLLGACRTCNSSKGLRLPGNVPGTWLPPNPTGRAVETMDSLGTWISDY